MSDQQNLDIAFATTVADVVGIQIELEEGNVDQAKEIADQIVEEHGEQAQEILE